MNSIIENAVGVCLSLICLSLVALVGLLIYCALTGSCAGFP